MPLTQAGYVVLTAVDSQELRYVCEFYPRPIDVVVLDIPLERDAALEVLLWFRSSGSRGLRSRSS